MPKKKNLRHDRRPSSDSATKTTLKPTFADAIKIRLRFWWSKFLCFSVWTLETCLKKQPKRAIRIWIAWIWLIYVSRGDLDQSRSRRPHESDPNLEFGPIRVPESRVLRFPIENSNSKIPDWINPENWKWKNQKVPDFPLACGILRMFIVALL